MVLQVDPVIADRISVRCGVSFRQVNYCAFVDVGDPEQAYPTKNVVTVSSDHPPEDEK